MKKRHSRIERIFEAIISIPSIILDDFILALWRSFKEEKKKIE